MPEEGRDVLLMCYHEDDSDPDYSIGLLGWNSWEIQTPYSHKYLARLEAYTHWMLLPEPLVLL